VEVALEVAQGMGPRVGVGEAPTAAQCVQPAGRAPGALGGEAAGAEEKVAVRTVVMMAAEAATARGYPCRAPGRWLRVAAGQVCWRRERARLRSR